MSQTEEIETMEGSDVIVNTEKEACAKGLVVSGGGKDGIFVKEVMKESSASKRLSLIEGDQILSATVFFDDVKYEDALQILEHAKPYKVQFCLKRHSSMTSEGSLTSLQESEKATMERGRSKTPRRQEARISWPKFPSFTRGRKMQFKRSHSTSEAEEQKKLDMSPTSSDTESPTKGQEPLKTKMKKPKLKLSNLGIKDLSIQSTDQHTTETVAEKSEHLEVIEKSPMKDESMVLSSKHPLRKEQETPEICAFESDENVDTTKIQNECLLPNVTGPEVEISQHKAELISLDKTLKTTDISIYGPKTDDILVEPGAERSRPKRTPEGKRRKKKQRSELKVNIKGKEKGDLSPDHQATSPQTLILIPSPHSLGPEVQFELQTTEPGGKTTEQLPLGDAPISPNVVSHAELKGRQLAIDINTQRVGSNRSSIKVDVMKPKVDVMSTKQTMKTEDGQKEGSDGQFDAITQKMGLQVQAPILKVDKDSREKRLPSPTTKSVLKSYEAKMEGPAILAQAERCTIKMPKKDEVDGSMPEGHFSLRKPPIGQQVSPRTEPGKQSKDGSIHVPAPEVSKMVIRGPYLEMGMPEKHILSSVTEIHTPKFEGSDISAATTATFLQTGDLRITRQTELEDIKTAQAEPTSKTDKPKIPKTVISLPGIAASDEEAALSKSEMFSMSRTKADVSSLPPVVAIKSPEMKSEPDLPQSEGKIDVKGYGVDVQAPKIRGELDADDTIGSIEKFKLPQFKVPKMDLSSLDEHEHITMTDVNAAKAKPDIVKAEIKAPKMDVNIQSTDADSGEIKGPKGKSDMPKLEMAEVDVQLPKVKPHKFGLKKPKSETGLYFSKPEMQIQGVNIDAQIRSIKSPADIPETQMESVKGKFKKPEIKIPSVGLLSGEYETTITKTDISHPKANIDMGKVQVTGPVVDLEASAARGVTDKETKGPGGKFKMPKIKVPQTGFSKSDVKVPLTDVDMNVPHGEVTLKERKIDVKVPGLELQATKIQTQLEGAGIQGSMGDLNLPTFKLPKVDLYDLDGHEHIRVTDVNASKAEEAIGIKNRKIKSQPDLPKSEGKIDVKDSEVELQAPIIHTEMDTDDIIASIEKFKLPKFKLPQINLSDLDEHEHITMTDVNLAKPKPDIATDSSIPEFKLPNIDLSDLVSDDVHKPITMTQVDVSSSNVKAEMKALPKVKGPEINIQMPKADTDTTLTKPELDIKGPDVEIKAPSLEASAELPDITAKGGKGKFHMPHIKMPSFGISTPDVKGPKVSGDISLPSVDVSLPKPDLDVKGPEISGPAVDVKLSKPELTVSGQKPALELKGPSVDIGGPALDVDMKGKGVEVEGEGGKFKLPKFGISLPKVDIRTQKPDVDISLPQAKLEGQLPTVELEGPSVEGKLEMPDIDAKGIDVKLKKPKISMPKFGMSKPEVKGPEAEIDVTLPKGDISLPEGGVDVKGPQVDIQGAKIEGDVKDIDIEGPHGKFKMPSFKMPKFGFSSGKVKAEAPEISADISVPEIEVPSGKAGIDIKSPDIDIQGPRVAIEKPDSKIELPKVKMPDIDIKLPQVKGTESDIKMQATTDISISKPEAESLDHDIDIKGSPTKFRFPTFTMPKFGISTSNTKSPDTEVSGKVVNLDRSGAEIGVEGPSLEIERPDIQSSDISLKKSSGFSISFPKLKSPEINISAENEGKSGKDLLSMPSHSIDGKSEGGISSSLRYPETKSSQADKGPRVESEGSRKTSRINLPSFGDILKGLDIEFHVPTLEDEEILASSKEDPSQSGVTEQGNEASDMSVAGKKLTSGVQLTEPSSSRPSMGVEGSLETKETESTQTKEKSGKFRFRFPKLGFSDSSQESSKTESTNLVMEAKEKPPPSPEKKLSTEKKETATKSDKGGWFKFPKLGISSPTKSTKDSQKEITQLSEDLEESTEGGPVEGEVSLMSSLKSSDAFADISSSEPIPSPTKVTVKFSEPTVRVAGGEMKSPAGIITSTARTELILLEPCLPEKMHTPTDPASVGAISPPEETSKQPAAHTQGTRNVQVVTSEKHGVTSTQSTTVITKMETSSVHALPVQKVTVKASSVPWTTEESAKGFPEPAGKHISVERHVVKEKSGDEKEKVVITRRVQSHQFEVASGESLAEGTASAIKRLKDTMHSEKLKFFESTEMSSASGSSHPSEKEESDKGAPPEKK